MNKIIEYNKSFETPDELVNWVRKNKLKSEVKRVVITYIVNDDDVCKLKLNKLKPISIYSSSYNMKWTDPIHAIISDFKNWVTDIYHV